MSENEKWFDRIRADYEANSRVYHLGVGIGAAAIVLLLAIFWLFQWWMTPESSPLPQQASGSKDGSSPDGVVGLLALIALFFLIRAMLRGTLQIYGTIAYFGLFALVVFLVLSFREASDAAKPYILGAIPIAVVLGAFIEIGSRIAFRLAEVNATLGQIKEALDKKTTSDSPDC